MYQVIDYILNSFLSPRKLKTRLKMDWIVKISNLGSVLTNLRISIDKLYSERPISHASNTITVFICNELSSMNVNYCACLYILET